MGLTVSISAPRVAEVVTEDHRELEPGEVRLRTLYSGISAGTELTAFHGSSPHLTKKWHPDTRLFSAEAASLEYPLTGWGGYEEVGEVVERAADVQSVALGDRIWGTWGHRSHTVVTAQFAAARVLPASVDPRIGIFSHIGAVALNVVLDADIHVGETVAVFGLGVPGQIVAQLARLNGARVVAVDGIAERRELAADLGAHVCLDPAEGRVAESIRDLTDGRGADVCLEVTGSHGALHEAIRSVAYSSRVVVAGFFQGGADALRLGEEFHHNRIQLSCSQISGPAPSVQHRWDRYRLARTAMDLAVDGDLALLDLITHTFPLSAVSDAFALLDQRSHDALQVVLDFEETR
jgi:2-desacetyl-2-hydroxyethyl bacteriochlorophyllide A dehydrogenase